MHSQNTKTTQSESHADSLIFPWQPQWLAILTIVCGEKKLSRFMGVVTFFFNHQISVSVLEILYPVCLNHTGYEMCHFKCRQN